MTVVIQSTPPERMWGDVDAKSRTYAALSRDYADSGDALGAVHALWASDLAAVQCVMWERIMVASPMPDEQFARITRAITKALLRYAHVTPERTAVSASDAVLGARQGLASAFDPTALRVVAKRLAAMDHLTGMPAPSDSDLDRWRTDRLGTSPDAHALAQTRKHTAHDGMIVAKAMLGEGRVDDAQTHAWHADWAAFEAYLVDAAIAVEDDDLVSVRLRWDLACASMQAVDALPADFADAVVAIRARLVDAVGAVEGQRLQRYFAAL